MKVITQIIGCAIIAAALYLGSNAQAQSTLYWDSNGVSSGAGVSPSGTWGSDSFWNTSANGTAGTFSISLDPGAGNPTSRGIFSAGNDATSSYVITVSGTQTASGLTFKNGTPTMTGGTILMTANSSISNNSTLGGTLRIASELIGSTLLGNSTLNLNTMNGTDAVDFLVTGNITTDGNNRLALRLGGNGTGRIEGAIKRHYGNIGSGTSSWTGVWTIAGNQSLVGDDGTGYTNYTALTLSGNNHLVMGDSINDRQSWTHSGVTSARATLTINSNATLTGSTQVSGNGGTIYINGEYQSKKLVLGETDNTYGTLSLNGTQATFNELDCRGTGISKIVGSNSNYATLTIDNNITGVQTLTSNIQLGGSDPNQNNIHVVKSGSGHLLIESINNTYTGNTTIKSGIFEISSDSRLGNGLYAASIINDGKIFYNGNLDQTISGSISGSGELVKNNTSSLILTGNNTYTGLTYVNGGSLVASTRSVIGDIHNYRTVTFAQDFDGTYAGSMSATGAFIKTGTGALTLASPNSYTGGTTVSAGSLIGTTTSVQGNILNNALVTFNQNFDGTFTGSMSGNGSLLKLGSGTLTLATANSYRGGTIVTAGGLTGTTDSLQGNILNNALVTFDQSFDGTFTGLMTGNGTLTKSGSGKVTIINSVPTISTTISKGDLNVNGVLASPLITVENTGALSGSGLIIGNVMSKGVVSPGNSPGILTVLGDYTQVSGSTLRIEIVDHSNYDKLIVGGKVSLGGGLQVVPSQSLAVKYGDRFDIILADQITGEFESIAIQSEAFRAQFVNFGTIGALLITPSDLTEMAVTPNQEEVASALNNYRRSACLDSARVTLALDLLTAEQYSAAFDQIMPSIYESYTDLSVEQSFINMQMINQRLGSVRFGRTGFASYGIDQPIKYDRNGRSASEPSDLKSHVEGFQEKDWNVWVMGTGIFSNSRNMNSIPDYRSNSGGFIAGSDYALCDEFTVGLYSGYQYSYTQYENDSSLEANTLLYGLYSSFVKDGYFADAVLGGGYTGGQANRDIQFGTLDRTAKSDPNNVLFTAGLNLGKDWNLKNFIITPMAGAQYTYVACPEFTETGAESLDLTLNQQNVSSLRTTLGGRIAYSWKAPIKLFSQALLITPEVRMFWVHEFLDDARTMQASLNGCEVQSFEYVTNEPIRNSVFAGVGFSAQIGENWNCSAFYNAAFNSNNLTTNIVSLGLGFSF